MWHQYTGSILISSLVLCGIGLGVLRSQTLSPLIISALEFYACSGSFLQEVCHSEHESHVPRYQRKTAYHWAYSPSQKWKVIKNSGATLCLLYCKDSSQQPAMCFPEAQAESAPRHRQPANATWCQLFLLSSDTFPFLQFYFLKWRLKPLGNKHCDTLYFCF